MNNFFPIHVRTVTGLEEVLAQELTALGAKDLQPKSRLVICNGDLELLYKANLWCRTAIRVLRPLASFPARSEKALYDGVKAIDWSEWLSPAGTLAIDGDVRSSFTTHSLYIAQLSKDAVVDQFREKTGSRPSVDLENPDLKIVVSLFQDNVQIYLDASGDSLHKRGYRQKAGDAPISETLAAGILKLSEWDGKSPILDPMCGSGTFSIEAGLLLRNVAPGLLRKHFGFQRWPDYDRTLFDRLVAEAKQAVRPDATVPIVGLDIDPGVVQIARENVERAGLTSLVQIECADFFAWEGVPETAGTLVMNPPYDERLPVENVAALYQRIGDRLKKRYGGWTAFVLCPSPEAVKSVGLRSSRRITLFNGSIETRLLKLEMRAGGLKDEASSERPPWRDKVLEINPRWQEKVQTFSNRLQKNSKHFGKWARREGISSWRAYDRDIPELPFIIDVYGDRAHFAEVQRNHDHSPGEHASYMQLMVKTAAQVMNLAPEKVYFKHRRPQESGVKPTGDFFEVTEGGHKFLINLADYVDVGLFLDHRKTRALIQKEASGKDLLNLFGYTGSLTVYAAAGGAKSTVTVDTSSTYLEWAEKNLALNGLAGPQHQFVRSDVLEFLEQEKADFDLAVVDPPARWVDRSSGREFDLQKDHVALLKSVLDRTRPGGKVFFSTTYRTFTIDEPGVREGRDLRLKEITGQTVTLDFEKKPAHRTWLLEL